EIVIFICLVEHEATTGMMIVGMSSCYGGYGVVYLMKQHIAEDYLESVLSYTQAGDKGLCCHGVLRDSTTAVGFHRNLQAGGEYEDKDEDFRRSPYKDKDTEDIRRYS
ncbi:hypothetical protein Tco_0924381, partial [Tanacetum coccineum]